MDPKLKAAIVAAINAYIDEQATLEAGKAAPMGRWARQGRKEALKAGQACFSRPRRWR